jgi:CheY-like chemotaxis protein
MDKRLLIVDDEEHIRKVIRLTLETAGYQVGEAESGERALTLFGNGSDWDAVILDQKMPGMDGLEVLKRIKDADPAARVIMVTAFASIELAVDAMKLGANDFVRKPMTPDIVRNAVAAALAKDRRVSSELEQPPSHKTIDAGPLIDIITMNGFHVVPGRLSGRPSSESPSERWFVVKAPNGAEAEIVVELDLDSVGYAERMTHKKLSLDSSFWTLHAQRTLTDYLWNEAQIPPGGRLKMHALGRDDIELAARWNS